MVSRCRADYGYRIRKLVLVLLLMDRPATSYAELEEANGTGKRTEIKEKKILKQRNDPYALLMHDSIRGNERGRGKGRTIANWCNNRGRDGGHCARGDTIKDNKARNRAA